MAAIFLFAMAAVNVVFIVLLGGNAPWNWASGVFCFGVGIAAAIWERP